MEKKCFAGRREDSRLVSGRGRYTSDFSFPGQLYASFKRSDRAHAAVISVSKTAAERSSGVVAVFIGKDFADVGFKTLPPSVPLKGRDGASVLIPERPILARDKVRFVGEEIAFVVAESPTAAADAAELIEVEYSDLPPVIGVGTALDPSAARLHDNVPGNLCFDFEYGDESKANKAFAQADRIVTLQVDSQRVAPNPMEPRCFAVAYAEETDTFQIYCSNQGGPTLRDGLSTILGISPEKVHVEFVDVGGAFGARVAPFPEYPALMHAARVLRRPIKWQSTRSEDFLTDNHGRAISLHGQLALTNDGGFLGLKTRWLCDTGAYLTTVGVFTNSINGMLTGANVYAVDALYGRHLHILTNTAPTSAYRGAGRPEAVYIVERLIDKAAQELGVDALDLRKRNLIRSSQLPYRTATNSVFDSGDFAGLIDRVRDASDWSSFEIRRLQAQQHGGLRGIGAAVFLKSSGGGAAPKDQVAMRFDKRGNIELFAVAGPSGQGHETIFPKLVAGWLGIDPDKVIFRGYDPTGPALVGSPASGSRSAMLQGSVFKTASDEVVQKAKALAADALEASPDDLEFTGVQFIVGGTDRSISLEQIIDKHINDSPHPLDTTTELPISRSFPSGAHVVEIEIDAETGMIEVVRYTSVDDIGNVLNSVLAEGQICGGIMQGAGQVFGENCLYDPTNGQLVAGSFMDYPMPRAHLIPDIEMISQGTPSPNNLLGAKGAGETGTTGAVSACMSAVLNALKFAGVDRCDMPATPARVWSALQEAQKKHSA